MTRHQAVLQQAGFLLPWQISALNLKANWSECLLLDRILLLFDFRIECSALWTRYIGFALQKKVSTFCSVNGAVTQYTNLHLKLS